MTKARLATVCTLATCAVLASFLTAAAMQRGIASDSNLALLADVIQLVHRDYVHPIGAAELTKAALKGMLSRLDPHSDYMDEREFEESQADILGRFGGLGMQLTEQDQLPKVISPIDDTPAARAGIEPGDEIISINHASTRGVDLGKIVTLLRGDPGTSVTLTILRGGQKPFDQTLTRQVIKVASVKSKQEPDGIEYVRITQFGGDTAEAFKQAIADFKRKANGRPKGLIVDLRDDPGGLLSAAVDVAGDLLDGGPVVSIKGRHASDNEQFSAPAKGDMLDGTPVVVLINGASASASEIVAGALQDRHRATVLGTRSFGKGSVQTIIPLRGHGAVRLTTALYYTASGRSIQNEGIAPDIVVEAPKDQQVSGGAFPSEGALRGALANPGALNAAPAAAGKSSVESAQLKAAVSPPIKADLIGKPDDAQLNAALSYLRDGARSGRR